MKSKTTSAKTKSSSKNYKKPASISKHARLVGSLGGRPRTKPASMVY